MIIDVSIDIEEEIRVALAPYVQAYCRPLPASLVLPSIEIRKVGNSEKNMINTFLVMIYARAEIENEADELLRMTIGLLEKIAKEQTTAIRQVTLNAGGSWTVDPVRPELAMCSATLMVVAHKSTMEV